MGEYDPGTATFTYIAGVIMPENTEVPEGFDYRDLLPCSIGNGFINGGFEDVFSRSHDITVEGIIKKGYKPDYSYGWSAEGVLFCSAL